MYVLNRVLFISKWRKWHNGCHVWKHKVISLMLIKFLYVIQLKTVSQTNYLLDLHCLFWKKKSFIDCLLHKTHFTFILVKIRITMYPYFPPDFHYYRWVMTFILTYNVTFNSSLVGFHESRRVFTVLVSVITNKNNSIMCKSTHNRSELYSVLICP